MLKFKSNNIPDELIIYLSHFILTATPILGKARAETRTHSIEGKTVYSRDTDGYIATILQQCGISKEQLKNLQKAVNEIETETGFQRVTSLLEYAIKHSQLSVFTCLLDLVFSSIDMSRELPIVHQLRRYGISKSKYDISIPFRVVYGADFLYEKCNTAVDLLPVILLCDHIISFEGLLGLQISREKEYAFKQSAYGPTENNFHLNTDDYGSDLRMLINEGVICPHDWTLFENSVLFYNTRHFIKEINDECITIFNDCHQEDNHDWLDAIMGKTQGYRNAVNLGLPAFIMPGDFIPESYYDKESGKSITPEQLSQLYSMELVTQIFPDLTTKYLPVDMILELKQELQARDSYLEFKSLLLELTKDFGIECCDNSYSEIVHKIHYDIDTRIKPTIQNLKRELHACVQNQKRHFFADIKNNGANILLNVGKIILGENRVSAAQNLFKTLYKSSVSGVDKAKVEFPKGYRFIFEVINIQSQIDKL